MYKFFVWATLGMTFVVSSYTCMAVDDKLNVRQQTAVEELTRAGVEFEFSSQSKSEPNDVKVRTIRIRAEDFSAWDKIAVFPEVEHLDLAGSSIGDSSIQDFATFKNLRELYLDGTEVTGASLAAIGRITTLETLSLANLKIEDEDLVELRNLKSISRLNLGGTLVTDASIAHLRLFSLTWINVGNTQVTSNGASELQQTIVTAEVEHNSIERDQIRAPIPSPALPATLPIELSPTITTLENVQSNLSAPELPAVDHARVKDGTPILAQILRTGAFVTFRDDDALKPIDEISFFGRKITDKSLKPLADLESLDELTVEDTRVTDNGFRNIAQLATVKSIRIVRSNVSGGVLANFSGLTGLESLVVDDLQITDNELSYLQSLTNLHILDLGATQVSDAGLRNIGQWLPKLKELRLLSNLVTAAGIEDLGRRLPAADLQIHTYDEAAVEAARPQFIAENSTDADAILNRWKTRGASINYDRESPQFVVNLEGGDFSDADLVDASYLLNLSTLTMRDLPISDQGLSHIQRLPRLKALNLSGTSVTDKGLELLVNMELLEELVLTQTRITNDGMQWLGKITLLKSLWLDETAVSDDGLVHLKSLPLERLEVPQVTDRGMQHIAHLSKLTRLDLPNVSDDGLKHLQHLKTLDILVLGAQVTDGGLKQLLPLNNNLNVLSLSGTKISDGGLASLKDFNRLEYLFLNDTSITDEGLKHLKSIPNLRRVDLERTAVTTPAIDDFRKTLPRIRAVNR